MDSKQQKIEVIKGYARAMYNEGWSPVIEAWDDEDIAKFLAPTYEETVANIQEIIDIKQEQEAGCW